MREAVKAAEEKAAEEAKKVAEAHAAELEKVKEEARKAKEEALAEKDEALEAQQAAAALAEARAAKAEAERAKAKAEAEEKAAEEAKKVAEAHAAELAEARAAKEEAERAKAEAEEKAEAERAKAEAEAVKAAEERALQQVVALKAVKEAMQGTLNRQANLIKSLEKDKDDLTKKLASAKEDVKKEFQATVQEAFQELEEEQVKIKLEKQQAEKRARAAEAKLAEIEKERDRPKPKPTLFASTAEVLDLQNDQTTISQRYELMREMIKSLKTNNFFTQITEANANLIERHVAQARKEHRSTEFLRIEFSESEEDNFVFGKKDIKASNFRACRFKNIDFSQSNSVGFSGINFYNCSFSGACRFDTPPRSFTNCEFVDADLATTVSSATLFAIAESTNVKFFGKCQVPDGCKIDQEGKLKLSEKIIAEAKSKPSADVVALREVKRLIAEEKAKGATASHS